MDTRLSCFIWGIVGVVFGLLALLFPEQMLATFYGIFLILIGLVIVVFLFLAITSKSDESLFWFGLSAGLLVLAVISYLAQLIVEIIFLLLIAMIVFYNGFTDIALALRHPRTKYFLIPGMFITGIALLAALLKYIPDLSKHLVIITLGCFAFVFGLFSIVMGCYHAEESIQEAVVINRVAVCQNNKHEGKK
ncbi:MAG: hypothetical protein NTZ37_02370 [Methanoregula sp.]|jgi:uncharacterized membrane protein HdeD (DUF308 family)|nr:hypothetical protein [Methanoregula sp.]